LETDAAISQGEENMDEGLNTLENKIEEEFSNEEKQLKRDIKSHIDRENKLKSVADHYKNKVKKCYYVISALFIIILILFILAVKSGNTPFSDTEKNIQDKYAAWAEELSEREQAIREKESQLGGETDGRDQGSDS